MEAIYRSECDAYVCHWLGQGGAYEAWTIDGDIHWHHDDRIQKRGDCERYPYPLDSMVVAYSAERYDQKQGSFTLRLAHCDPSKVIVPWTGNTILEQREVVFRRRVPWQQTPRWLKAALSST
jgi:hypothetical protein